MAINRKFGKILAIALSLLMIFTVMPATTGLQTAYAAEGSWSQNNNIYSYSYSASDGNCLFSYDMATTTLIVSANSGSNARIPDFEFTPGGNGVAASGNIPPWYSKFSTNISKIEIKESVSEIGDYAFANLNNLGTVIIGNGTVRIGNHAFENCISLSNVEMGNKIATIGDRSFAQDASIKEITIPSSVRIVGQYAFEGLTSASNIKIPYYTGDRSYAKVNGKEVWAGEAKIQYEIITKTLLKDDAAMTSVAGYPAIVKPASSPGLYNNVVSANGTTEYRRYASAGRLVLRAIPAAGYTYSGWYDGKVIPEKFHEINSNSVNPRIDPEGQYNSGNDKPSTIYEVNVSAPATYYAEFTEGTYIAQFNAAGGKFTDAQGAGTTSFQKSVKFGQTYGALPTVTRTGYSFENWYDEENHVVKAETPVKAVDTAIINLVAKWTPHTYTIRYNSGSGSGSMVDQTVSYGTVGDKLAVNQFSKQGYSFAGWALDENSHQVKYSDGYELEEDLSTENGTIVNLYAVWKYNIKFDANTGSGLPMAQQTLLFGKPTVLNINTYTKKNSRFVGWGKSANSDTADYNDKQEISESPNPSVGVLNTLFAIWKTNTFTLSYDTNLDGVSLPSSFVPITKAVDMGLSTDAAYFEAEVPEEKLTDGSYSFLGWSTDKNAAEPDQGLAFQEDHLQNKIVKVSKNTILYAVWKPKEITLSFGTGGDSSVYGQGVSNVITAIGVKTYLPDCTYKKTGYNFAGWKDTNTNTVYKSTATKRASGVFSTDTSFITTWEPITYSVTFLARNYDEVGSLVPAKITGIKYTDDITIPKTTLIRKGYTFKGWSRSQDASVADYAAAGVTIPEAKLTAIDGGEIILYDVWDADAYTIKFNGNGGIASSPMEDKNLPYGEEWKLTKNTFTQEGFEFTGWSRTPNGEVEFKDEAKVINLATSGDVNLYAVWRPTCLLSFEIALDNVIKNDSGDSIVIGDDKKTVTKIAIPDNTNLNGYKLAAVAATGHEFLGWKLKNDNGEISESYISNNTNLADYTFSGRKFTVVACFKTIEYKVYVEKLINGKITVSLNEDFSGDNVAVSGTEKNTMKYVHGDTLYVKIELDDPQHYALGELEISDGNAKVIAAYTGNNVNTLLKKGSTDEGFVKIYTGTVEELLGEKGKPYMPCDLNIKGATDKIATYFKVKAVSGANGTVTPAGETVYNDGETAVYTVIPAEGYFIESVKVDNEDKTPVGEVTTGITVSITKDATITASFAKLAEYVNVKLNPVDSDYGSVSVTPVGRVKQGTEIKVDVNPKKGYDVRSITINGVSRTSKDSYKFNANQDTIIDVSFETVDTSSKNKNDKDKDSDSRSKYTIRGSAGNGGDISISKETVKAGKDLTVTITPHRGYIISSLIVDGKDVPVSTSYTFRKVDADHTIIAMFKIMNLYGTNQYGVMDEKVYSNGGMPISSTSSGIFRDVSVSSWYYPAIQYIHNMGLLAGLGSTNYYPESNASRAMIVALLYNNEGAPAGNYNSGFRDVNSGGIYANAVNWAAARGIVKGITDTNFEPESSVTREQLATIMYRYARLTGRNVGNTSGNKVSSYKDANQISNYAETAMNWACNNGLIEGRSPNTLVPDGTTTRAELAAIMMRFKQNL
ncbi:MAG: InlB B-repeat-containing protein [Anaerovoracaceae bacterium]